MTFPLLFARSINSCFIDPAPSQEIAFLTPKFSKFLTSFLPSTTINESLDSIFGPQVSPWKFFAVPTVRTLRTSSITVFVAASPELTISSNRSFARSITAFTLVDLTSWISLTVIFAAQGPILSIVSRLDAIIAVSTLSMLLGIKISPFTFPPLDFTSTST